MTAWASLLIPAGAAATGGLITGASAIWAQVLTHRVTSQREREARHDAFTIKRFEIERETLLSLQEAVSRLHTLNIHNEQAMSSGDILAVSRERMEVNFEVAKLAGRTLDKDARDSAMDYAQLSIQEFLPDPRKQLLSEELTDAFGKAMSMIGRAIRRDPFDGRAPRANNHD